jgi:hypothetical protein
MASAPSKSIGTAPRLRDEGWTVGELVGHGEAPYQNDPQNSNSYYIRIRAQETEAGARRAALTADESSRPMDGRSREQGDARQGAGIHIAWGTGLRRAIKQSKSHAKIRDVVGVRRVGRDPVYDKAGKVIPNRYETRWEVETVQFIQQRHSNARKVIEDYRAARQDGIDDPEARAIYFIQSNAEKLAALRYPNPEDQKRFIEGVSRALERPASRESLIASVAQRLQAKKPLTVAAEPSRERSTEHGDSELRNAGIARE